MAAIAEEEGPGDGMAIGSSFSRKAAMDLIVPTAREAVGVAWAAGRWANEAAAADEGPGDGMASGSSSSKKAAIDVIGVIRPLQDPPRAGDRFELQSESVTCGVFAPPLRRWSQGHGRKGKFGTAFGHVARVSRVP